MKPKAILLDWDGTVVDGFHLIHQAMNETLQHYGEAPWDDKTAALQIPRPDKEKFPEIFGEHWQEPLNYFYAAITRIGESIEKPDLIPGAEKFMAFLQEARRNGTYVGIVSNSRTPAILRELHQCGWDGFVDVIVASDSGVKNKPDIAAYEKAMEGYPGKKPPARDVLYIGDANTDLQFARNTGMKFIGIGDKFTLPMTAAEKAQDLHVVRARLQLYKPRTTDHSPS